MKRLSPKEYCYTMGKYCKPAITIEPGETVVVETADNTTNRVKKAEDVAVIPNIKHYNPLSGPIFVQGAQPGDTLAVYINDIKPLTNQGWGGEFPGGLSTVGDATGSTYLLNELRPITVYISKVENGMVKIPLKNRELSVPYQPLIGTIGVAPELDSVSPLISGVHGGNMDSPDITIGNKLFLPVFTEGALLFVGDVHALQSEGEFAGPPLEIAAECTLTIDIVKKTIKWPRIESPDYIMTVGNSCPVDNCLRIANTEMLYWLRDEYGFILEDAVYLSSLLFRVRVNTVENLLSPSVSVMFPKKYLPR